MRLALLVLCPFLAYAADLFVAPAGSDTNPGTKDKPFATLQRAITAARTAQPATIQLMDGTYVQATPLTLTAADSGLKIQGDNTRLIAAKAVPPATLHLSTDPRLDPEAKGHVYEIDTATLGLSHTKPFPDNFADGGGIIELYCAGKRLPLSRWPNRGYVTMAKVLDKGDWSNSAKRHPGKFTYSGDRPARWVNAVSGGLWLDGFWRVPWTPEKVRIASITPSTRTISMAVPINGGIGSKYGGPQGDGKEPWYALNLVEEIDTPGEWALDFTTKKLYLWPPAPVKDGELLIADLGQPILTLNNASHITITGVTFEGGLGDGIHINGGSSNLIAGSTFRNLGGTGIIIEGGVSHTVQSSDFSNLGKGGVYVNGGDRKTLTPSNHRVVNNHMHHLGETQKTYAPAISLSFGRDQAVGVYVAHNLIHDLPHAAVLYSGNDHLIELNEVHNIALDSGDVGAFYTTNDWTSRGNILRYNFVHHATAANAFYMDDGDCGDLITGNVIYQTSYGPFIGGGHDNIVRNNLVIESKRGLHMDSRGIARHYDTTDKHKMALLNAIDYQHAPWSTKYPDLLKILDHPELPSRNVIEDNAVVGSPEPFHIDNPQYSTVRNNITLSTNAAQFTDPATLNFRPKPASPLLTKLPHLAEIPYATIGLQIDQYRKRLPTAQETGRLTDRRKDAAFDSDTDRKASDKK